LSGINAQPADCLCLIRHFGDEPLPFHCVSCFQAASALLKGSLKRLGYGNQRVDMAAIRHDLFQAARRVGAA